jgi:hypothetical protein
MEKISRSSSVLHLLTKNTNSYYNTNQNHEFHLHSYLRSPHRRQHFWIDLSPAWPCQHWPQSVDRTAQNEVLDENQCNLEAEITIGFLRSITAPKGTGHPLSALYTAQNLLDNCEGALSEKNQADLCDEVDRIKPLVLEKIALPSIPQCAGSISAQQLQHANTWPRRTLQHANTWPRRSLQHANTSPLELQRSKTAPFSTADDFCIPSGVYVGGNGGICDKCCGNRCIVHYTRPGGCPDGYDICLGYYCS